MALEFTIFQIILHRQISNEQNFYNVFKRHFRYDTKSIRCEDIQQLCRYN